MECESTSCSGSLEAVQMQLPIKSVSNSTAAHGWKVVERRSCQKCGSGCDQVLQIANCDIVACLWWCSRCAHIFRHCLVPRAIGGHVGGGGWRPSRRKQQRKLNKSREFFCPPTAWPERTAELYGLGDLLVTSGPGSRADSWIAIDPTSHQWWQISYGFTLYAPY